MSAGLGQNSLMLMDVEINFEEHIFNQLVKISIEMGLSVENTIIYILEKQIADERHEAIFGKGKA